MSLGAGRVARRLITSGRALAPPHLGHLRPLAPNARLADVFLLVVLLCVIREITEGIAAGSPSELCVCVQAVAAPLALAMEEVAADGALVRCCSGPASHVWVCASGVGGVESWGGLWRDPAVVGAERILGRVAQRTTATGIRVGKAGQSLQGGLCDRLRF